jgi:hypothetical protein
VDEKSVAARAPYVLYRVHQDGTEELIGEHSAFESGWKAGTRVVTVEDKENAYSLYDRGRRVAKFGHARLMPRLGAERVSSMVGAL